jgi:hypothetical protein
MSSSESVLLRSTNLLLDEEIQRLGVDINPFNCRLSILEAISSILGGWDLAEFNLNFNKEIQVLNAIESLRIAKLVLQELKKTEIPISLGLSALAR